MTVTDDAGVLRSIATRIASEAGALVLEIANERATLTSLRDDAVRKSSSTDLSTKADRASEQLIVLRLRELRPDDGVIAEEGSTQPSMSGINWIVDPIDGTTNFVYGFGSFAVSIAAVRDGVALAGAVYDPLRNEMFSAALGLGAHCNDVTLEPPPVAAPLAEALIGTGFSYRSNKRFQQAKLLTTILPRVRDIRRQGAAALDLCYVAAQRLDGYYEAGLRPWDRAAGLLIAEEAGYVHDDLDLPDELAETLVVTHRDLLSPLLGLLIEAAGLHQV